MNEGETVHFCGMDAVRLGRLMVWKVGFYTSLFAVEKATAAGIVKSVPDVAHLLVSLIR